MNVSRKLPLVKDEHESPSSGHVGVDEDELIEAVAEPVRDTGDYIPP